MASQFRGRFMNGEIKSSPVNLSKTIHAPSIPAIQPRRVASNHSTSNAMPPPRPSTPPRPQDPAPLATDFNTWFSTRKQPLRGVYSDKASTARPRPSCSPHVASQSKSTTEKVVRYKSPKPSSGSESLEDDLASLSISMSPLLDSSPIASNPLVEFVLFPELPARIRVRIWQTILSQPQIIEIRDKSEGHRAFYHNHLVLLAISQQSRTEAEKCLSSVFCGPDSLPLVMINPQVDILYLANFPAHVDIHKLHHSTLHSLKSLAVYSGNLKSFLGVEARNPGVLLHHFANVFLPFKVLEQLSFVIDVVISPFHQRCIGFYDAMKISVGEFLEWRQDGFEDGDYLDLYSDGALAGIPHHALLRPAELWGQCDWIMRMLRMLAEKNPDWKVPNVLLKGAIRE